MSSPTLDPALLAAIRYGLPEPAVSVRLDPGDSPGVAQRAGFDHLTGFLAAAIIEGIVAVEAAESVDQIMAQWHDELLACVVLEALIVRTAEHLDAAGVTWRLTKGAALAHLDYDDPSLRTFGDVDLIVHPDDWTKAVETLASHGYRREAGELPGDYDRRYGKGATLSPAEGLQVDLHRRYAIGRFGVTSKMEDVFASPDHIKLAGREIPTLNAEHRLLHGCFHASLGGFRRLRAFRDVAQLILVAGADVDRTFALARQWRAEAVVASAIKDTWSRLQLATGHDALDRAQATVISRGDARALRVFHESQPFRRKALTAIPRLAPSKVPGYLWSLGSNRLPWKRS